MFVIDFSTSGGRYYMTMSANAAVNMAGRIAAFWLVMFLFELNRL